MSGCPFNAGGNSPPPAAPIEPTEVHHHDAKLDFHADMSYGDYLHLDAVLNAQHPLSPDHNEIGRAHV